MLLLTLAGVAVGVSVVEPGADSPRAITIGAATWQTISMLVAAIVGGYVAARLSGLRRTADGVLHGAVSWGATTVLYAALATTALGTLTAGMFGLLAPGNARARASGGDAVRDRRSRSRRSARSKSIGLTAEQARIVVDQLTAARPRRTAAPADAPAGRRSGGHRRHRDRLAERDGAAVAPAVAGRRGDGHARRAARQPAHRAARDRHDDGSEAPAEDPAAGRFEVSTADTR